MQYHPSIFLESKTNICTYCLLQGFLHCTVGVVQPAAAVFHPWVLWRWFIRGRGPWAAISPFPSVLWLPDNIQLSLMCHQGPMVRLSALLFHCSAHWGGNIPTCTLNHTVTHADTRATTHTKSPNEIHQCLFQFSHWMRSVLALD